MTQSKRKTVNKPKAEAGECMHNALLKFQFMSVYLIIHAASAVITSEWMRSMPSLRRMCCFVNRTSRVNCFLTDAAACVSCIAFDI